MDRNSDGSSDLMGGVYLVLWDLSDVIAMGRTSVVMAEKPQRTRGKRGETEMRDRSTSAEYRQSKNRGHSGPAREGYTSTNAVDGRVMNGGKITQMDESEKPSLDALHVK